MADKPTKGTEVSFTNTPQAKDDKFIGLVTEDSADATFYLDVMANDLAGKAKSLWALDRGKLESESESSEKKRDGGDSKRESSDDGAPEYRLLQRDTIGVKEVSARGAKIWITQDGKVAYQLTPELSASLQSLNAGEKLADSFIYAIQMGNNGTLSWAKVEVVLAGVNDVPVVQNVSVAAVEDGPAVTGSFIGDDVDSDDTPSSLIYNIATSPALGTLTKSGTSFTYDPGSNFQELAVGETKALNFTYTATDKHGAVSAPATGTITVTGVNDAPEIASADASGSVVEDGTASASGQITATDVDNGATQTWSVVGPSAGLYGSIGVDTNGKWTYTLANGTNGEAGAVQSLAEGESVEDSFTIRVDDSKGGTADQDITVSIVGSNDAPTLTAGSMGTNEDSSATLDLAALGEDIDSDNDGSDLVYSTTAPTKGSATVTGTDLSFDPGSAFQYLAAGETATLDLEIQAKDKHGASADSKVTVTVTGVNDAPVITGGDPNGSVTASPGVAAFTVQQWINYPGGNYSLANIKSYTGSNPASYTVTTNVIDYTDDPGGFAGDIPGSSPWPAAAATGASGTGAAVNNTFVVRITGQLVVTTTDTYTFRTYNDDGVYLHVNNQLIINDPGLHPEQVFTGSITLTPGVYPIELYFFEHGGEASLEFTYKNSTGTYTHVVAADKLSDSGVIAFKDVDLTDTHTVVVAPTGSTLGSLTATVAKDSTGTGTGGELGWNYSVNNKDTAYLGAGESVTDTFTVTVDDNKGGSAQQTVSVLVNGVNDVPVITSTTDQAKGNTKEDTDLTVSGTVTISDPDVNDTHTWSIAANTSGVYGTASVDNGGKWTYTLNNGTDGDGTNKVQSLKQGETVNETFTVRASDGKGGSADQIVHVVVAGINDAALISTDSKVLTETNAAQTASGALTISDIDSPASFNAQSLAGQYGTLTLQSTGAWSYVMDGAHNEFEQGKTYVDTFGVSSVDGTTKANAVTITIAGSNDPAVITGQSKTITETNQAESTGGTLTVTDVDSPQTFNPQSAAGKYGTMALASDGTWTYTMDGPHNEFEQGKNYVDKFTVTSADGTTLVDAVTVTIAGSNDAPTAVNDSNALTVAPITQVSPTTVHWVDWTQATTGQVKGVIALPGGQNIDVTYTGDYYFAQTSSGIDYYTTPAAVNGDLTAGTGTYTSATVTNGPTGYDIIGLNKATTRTLSFSQAVDDLFFAVVSLNGNGYRFDQDFDILSYGRGYWGDGGATKTALADGRFELRSVNNSNTVPQSELHGVVGIKGSITSLTWDSLSPETWNGFTIGIHGQAQTAVATGNLLANDTDPENNPRTVASVNGQNIVGNSVTLTLGSGARLTVNKDGSYTYDENGAFGALTANQSVVDTFNYVARDSLNANSNSATVQITVTGVNDAPKAMADTISTAEDTAVIVNVLANDSDVDQGDTLTLSSVANGAHGTVVIENGQAKYTPNANYFGNDSFTYTVQDAAGLSSTATVSVVVTSVVDTYTPQNLVKNGSFSSYTTGVTVTAGTETLTGWTVPNDWTLTGNVVDVVSGWYDYHDQSGNVSLDLNAYDPGGVKQSIATASGQSYSVAFLLSKNPGASSATAQVTAPGFLQDYAYSQSNSDHDMKWELKTFTFTATGTSSELSFSSQSPSNWQAGKDNGFPNDAQGPALDQVVAVTNQQITGFVKGTGGDVLALNGILTAISAPHDNTAFSLGYLQFQAAGADTVVRIDPNGGGDSYLAVATLVGVNLLQTDISNFTL